MTLPAFTRQTRAERVVDRFVRAQEIRHRVFGRCHGSRRAAYGARVGARDRPAGANRFHPVVRVDGAAGAGQADEHVCQGFGDQCPVGGRVAGAPGCVITKSVGCVI
ncbi:hypothetical protein [Komagataeibacter europaeus]|uniref:hypothetical protein n=1 Tax=Komagataeibacter europaeus TaxID=33995 RepID=UPI0013A07E57|nr:hypothetical protein [Komagataeibacter europaeus]